MRVQFYLARPTVKRETGKPGTNPQDTAIVANIHLDGKLMRVGTGLSIQPKYWNKNTHRAKMTPAFREGSSLNTLLDTLQGQITKSYYDYRNDNGAAPSAAVFKTMVDTVMGRSKTVKLDFWEYAEDFITRTRDGQRQNVKGGMIRSEKGKHYGSTVNSLKDFAREQRRKIDFDTINLEFYEDYTTWLRGKTYSENYIGNHIKNLKAILNEATERGANTNLAYKSKRFVKPVEDVDNIALSEADLKALEQLDLSGRPGLDRVRDQFLVGCYTGLRFSDFSRLTADNIREGFIEITQQKTGKPVVIPIHQVVSDIIAKYEGGLPEAISQQKTNDYLKDICKQVKSFREKASKTKTTGGMRTTVNYEKWEIVTTHTARRTFATNAYRQGIPTISIMAITGHKTERSFLKYIKVTSKEHAKIMAGVWNRNEMEKVN
jgi:integrase